MVLVIIRGDDVSGRYDHDQKSHQAAQHEGPGLEGVVGQSKEGQGWKCTRGHDGGLPTFGAKWSIRKKQKKLGPEISR